MEKTIWIINQYASHLETRHWELAKSFEMQGYKVAVITSSFHHGKKEYLYDSPMEIVEQSDNIKYYYLHSNPAYESNGGKRVLNMLEFCRLVKKYRKKIVFSSGKPAYIIASSAPPFVWSVGYKLSKKYDARFIAEFRDIWPLSLVEIQGVNPRHPFVRLLGIIEKNTYKKADAIVSTMPYGWKHIKDVAGVSKDKVHWMANGINFENANKGLTISKELPDDIKDYLTNNWCGVYIGSIVKSESVDYLLKGISRVKDTDIHFAIIGDGQEKERLQKLADEMNLSNVRFFPAIDKDVIPKALKKAHFCLAALNDLPIYDFGLSMNKLNDYLASGKPTIFVCNVDNVVKQAGHFSIQRGDEEELAKTIEHMKCLTVEELSKLEKNAKRIIKEEYDYVSIGKKYLKMMEDL